MKILCIDDKNRPDEIPIEKWVVEGREYTPFDSLSGAMGWCERREALI